MLAASDLRSEALFAPQFRIRRYSDLIQFGQVFFIGKQVCRFDFRVCIHQGCVYSLHFRAYGANFAQFSSQRVESAFFQAEDKDSIVALDLTFIRMQCVIAHQLIHSVQRGLQVFAVELKADLVEPVTFIKFRLLTSQILRRLLTLAPSIIVEDC